MDIFAQKKQLTRIVIILILLNIGTIGFFVFSKMAHRRGGPPADRPDNKELTQLLKEELNLTEEQAEKFKTLRQEFFAKERKQHELIRAGRDSMNEEMFSITTNDSLLHMIAKRVSENEYKMELLRIEQAKQLKTICTPEQLKKFDNLVIEIRDYFKPRKGPRP